MGLFKPAWMSNNEEKAIMAVKSLVGNDLVLAARTAPSVNIRIEAINRLTEQSILANFAKYDNDIFVREAAMKKITDQSILADFARNTKDWTQLYAVVENLTDQSVLEEIAKNDEFSFELHVAAIEKLTNNFTLTEIAKNDNMYYEERIAAAEKLPDQTILKSLAKNAENWMVLNRAVRNISDQSILVDLVNNSREIIDFTTGLDELIGMLEDKTVLVEIAYDDNDVVARWCAMANLFNKQILSNDEIDNIMNNLVKYMDGIKLDWVENMSSIVAILKTFDHSRFGFEIKQGYIDGYSQYILSYKEKEVWRSS